MSDYTLTEKAAKDGVILRLEVGGKTYSMALDNTVPKTMRRRLCMALASYVAAHRLGFDINKLSGLSFTRLSKYTSLRHQIGEEMEASL